MNSKPVYLDACTGISSNGLFRSGAWVPWEQNQSGPADIRRAQVLSIPYPSFGKLVLADRLSFAAACLLFNTYPDCVGEQVGICAAVPYGSLSTDLQYQSSLSTIPSPALFSATLPSSVVSEVAIYFKLKGPNRVFVNIRGALITAIDAAFRMITLSKADSILVLYANVINDEERQQFSLEESAQESTAAWALLFTATPRHGGLRQRTTLTYQPATTVSTYSENDHVMRHFTSVSAPDGSGRSDIQYGGTSVIISTIKER